MTWRTNCLLDTAFQLLMQYQEQEPNNQFILGPPQAVEDVVVELAGSNNQVYKYTLPGISVDSLNEMGMCGIYEDH